MIGLNNKIIAVTKSKEEAGDDFDELIRLGARMIFIPFISIEPLENYSIFDTAVNNIYSFQYLIFTSAAGVKFFAERISLLKVKMDYSRLCVACVGLKTADACRQNGIPVNIIPKTYDAGALCNELAKNNLKGKKILIPCSNIAREELPNQLKELGAEIHSIPVYETKMPLENEIAVAKEAFTRSKIDLIAFTSPSSFHNFLMIFNITAPYDFFNDYKIAAIGNTTKNAIAVTGIDVDIVPDESTLKGLAIAIMEFYK